MALNKEAVLEVLKTIAHPGGGDIVSSGVVRAVNVDEGDVRFVMEIEPDQATAFRAIQAEAEERLEALDGVRAVSVVMTAHQTAKPPPDLKGGGKPEPKGPQKVEGVKHIVAVASGKGGVGKSTVSSNLACALAARGLKVGILDADFYGPSLPKMLGVSERPSSPDGKIINPLTNHGISIMSLGLMVEEGKAVVWRGPMLMGAIRQMMTQVAWKDLDILVVDLPPGTGDVQMNLAQQAVVDGAVIVSTPQDVALLDTRKGIDMFNKMHVPILGMVENMSTHVCSNCGHEEHLFGHGGVAKEAAKMGVPLLAEIPLQLDIRVAADSGAPIVITEPNGPGAAAFHELAARVAERVMG